MILYIQHIYMYNIYTQIYIYIHMHVLKTKIYIVLQEPKLCLDSISLKNIDTSRKIPWKTFKIASKQ